MEVYTCFEYVYIWPRLTKLIVSRVGIAWGNVCVQVRYVLWGLIVKDPLQKQTLIVVHFFHFFHFFFLSFFHFFLLLFSSFISGKKLELCLERLTLQLFFAETLISS